MNETHQRAAATRQDDQFASDGTRLLLPLGLASACGVGLLMVRMVYSGSLAHGYLAWNLLLAWCPLAFALLAVRSGTGRSRLAWGFLWLIFLPNAPYLVTDLVHLRPRPPVPLWFDILLLQGFIGLGLLTGFASLRLMQREVAGRIGHAAGWGFVTLVLGLSGFGVYIGRFLRWNSWDVFLNPWDLLGSLWTIYTQPLANPGAVGFPLLFSTFLLAGYLAIAAFDATHRRWLARHSNTPPTT